MGKQKPRGICRICGEYKKLSFEHVPPGATYNKKAVRFVSIKDIIETEKENEAMPWEVDKIKGRTIQRGRGDYYICEKCNNDTGSWYAKHYKKFVDAFMCVMYKEADRQYQNLTVKIEDIRPLPIIKQILTMFCDINENLAMKDESLKSFIMDKHNRDLDINKYRIFMYMLRGGLQKTAPLSVMINTRGGKSLVLSEIAAVPVGFILYMDIPSGYEPLGTEITYFAQYKYEEEKSVNISVDVYETNTWLPTDFRSKEEIKATMETVNNL